MEDQLFYSTGRAATELGVSQAQIRALCESGVIQTELTPGGQWRISKAELDRLRAEGLPAIPRPLPGTESRRPSGNRNGIPPALYAEPSEQVVDAAEEVVVLEHEVKSLGLRRQKEEALDWFRRREAEERAAEDERDREAQASRAQEAARREREEWLQSWEVYGLGRLPYDCPPDVRLKVHEAIRARLAPLDPIPAAVATQGIVEAIDDHFVAEWKREAKVEEILVEARDRMLPSAATGSWGKITDWQVRAVKAADAAIIELREDAPMEEVRAVVVRAVQGVAAEFEADQAAKADAEMRERVIRWTRLPAWIPPESRQSVEKLIQQKFAALPVGSPWARLEQEVNQVLADLNEAYRQQQAEQEAQTKAKEQHRNDAITASRGAAPHSATGKGPEPTLHRPPVVTRLAPQPAAGPEPFRHRPPVINR